MFRNRNAVLLDPRSATGQATFGSDVAAGELPYATVGIAYERPTANVVRSARAAEAALVQQALDTDSMFRYGWHIYDRSDLLMTTDDAAARHAAWLLEVSWHIHEADTDRIYLYAARSGARSSPSTSSPAPR